MQYISFIQDPSNDYLGETIAYLKLCGFSIAAAIIIGVLLGAFIAAVGYGDYIVDAINVGNNTELIVGAVSVAILAIFVEVFMSWLQSALTPQGLKVQEQVATAKA